MRENIDSLASGRGIEWLLFAQADYVRDYTRHHLVARYHRIHEGCQIVWIFLALGKNSEQHVQLKIQCPDLLPELMQPAGSPRAIKLWHLPPPEPLR